jgi:hypothetical protein
MHSLGLALPQFGKGKFSIQQSTILSFGKAQDETFTLEFKGGWERYKRFKHLTDAFSQEAEEFKVGLRVGAEFDGGLEVEGQDFLNIRDILATLEIGRITLEVVPQYEQMGVV